MSRTAFFRIELPYRLKVTAPYKHPCRFRRHAHVEFFQTRFPLRYNSWDYSYCRFRASYSL